MTKLTQRMLDIADRIHKGKEFGLQEVEDALREGANTLDIALAMLNKLTEIIEQDLKGKDDGKLH